MTPILPENSNSVPPGNLCHRVGVEVRNPHALPIIDDAAGVASPDAAIALKRRASEEPEGSRSAFLNDERKFWKDEWCLFKDKQGFFKDRKR